MVSYLNQYFCTTVKVLTTQQIGEQLFHTLILYDKSIQQYLTLDIRRAVDREQTISLFRNEQTADIIVKYVEMLLTFKNQEAYQNLFQKLYQWVCVIDVLWYIVCIYIAVLKLYITHSNVINTIDRILKNQQENFHCLNILNVHQK